MVPMTHANLIYVALPHISHNIVMIGTPASFLEQYSVSLQSATSLIATLTINESSLWGAWQISLHGYGSYNILVSALSDLSFSSELFAAGLSSSAFGFSAVVGKHLKGTVMYCVTIILQKYSLKMLSFIPSGQLLIAAFQASDDDASLTVDAINVVDPEGTVLQSIDDVVSLGDNMFVGNFTPPAVSTFHWQISGKDEEGYSFSRISDTAIEVSDIELMLGIVLQSYTYYLDVHGNISAIMYNCIHAYNCNSMMCPVSPFR